MNKRDINGGGKSFLSWWNNPKNRQKVYDSDRADAEELKKQEDLETDRIEK